MIEVSLIKIATGELLIGHCVGVTNQAVHLAFPYIINEDKLDLYLPQTTNRYYTFAMKDIIFFKDINDETKAKYGELVLAKESKEYESFRESTKEVKIPDGCYVHSGNLTIH